MKRLLKLLATSEASGKISLAGPGEAWMPLPVTTSFRMTFMFADHSIRHVRICNEDGLHLRAAVLLSQQARRFPCEIRISCGDRHADAKSVWDLIGLMAEMGRELVLKAKGFQSEKALDVLEALVAGQFQVSEEEDYHEIA